MEGLLPRHICEHGTRERVLRASRKRTALTPPCSSSSSCDPHERVVGPEGVSIHGLRNSVLRSNSQ